MKIFLMLAFLSLISCSTTPEVVEQPSLPKIAHSYVMKIDECIMQLIIEFEGHEELLVTTIPQELICGDDKSFNGEWIY